MARHESDYMRSEHAQQPLSIIYYFIFIFILTIFARELLYVNYIYIYIEADLVILLVCRTEQCCHELR